MATDGIIQLDPTDYWHTIEPNGLYSYRGLLIVGDADGNGATVGTLESPDSELGWGSTMKDAMIIANEVVDECERTPVRLAA